MNSLASCTRRHGPACSYCSSGWARTIKVRRFALTLTLALTTSKPMLNACFSSERRKLNPAAAGSFFVTRPDWCFALPVTLPTLPSFDL